MALNALMEKTNFCRPKISVLIILFALLGLAALCSGCAALSLLPVSSLVGSPNANALEIHNTTEARLQEKNFIVVRTNVTGQASGFSLLGILTIVPARFNKAMGRLYDHAQMQTGHSQTLVDIVMEQDSINFILFTLPRISLSADVVEFVPSAALEGQSRPPPEQTPPKT
jgi:hypothetical protein